MSYLSLDQAAERLNVSKRTIRRAIAAGELPAYRMGQRVVRVKADDVEALLRPIPTAAA